MKNLINYQKYFPIQSGKVSDEFEREFCMHKDLVSYTYGYVDGMASVGTFYHENNLGLTELLSYVKTPYLSYIVHSLNSRDTIFYPIDEVLSEIVKKYGKEHLESIISNPSFVIGNFSNEYKLKDSTFYLSKKLTPTLAYKFSLEEKNLEVEDVIDFFTNFSFLEEDLEEVLCRMYL